MPKGEPASAKLGWMDDADDDPVGAARLSPCFEPVPVTPCGL